MKMKSDFTFSAVGVVKAVDPDGIRIAGWAPFREFEFLLQGARLPDGLDVGRPVRFTGRCEGPLSPWFGPVRVYDAVVEPYSLPRTDLAAAPGAGFDE